jgi:hypothetical protein
MSLYDAGVNNNGRAVLEVSVVVEDNASMGPVESPVTPSPTEASKDSDAEHRSRS